MFLIIGTYFGTGSPGNPRPIMLCYSAYRTPVYTGAVGQTGDLSGSEKKKKE